MLRDAKPSRLEDLIALNAMFRPGPMDNIPSFCARKHGREEVTYPHPLLEKVLGETYGIMVYQEQVMQAAQVLGGYSLGGADLLRRAMGKKKAEEMATAPRDLPRGRGREGDRRGSRRRGLRPDGEVRRLRLQQVARRRLLAAGVPHGLDQGPLHGRVLRRQHDGRARRHRQAEGAARRCPGLRRDAAGARRQRRHLSLRAGRRQDDPLRPGRDQGHRPGRDRGHRRGARGQGRRRRRRRSAACSTSARAWTGSASTGAWSRRW